MTTTSTSVVDVDVLVVGGGGAASRAALEAARTGAKVVMAVKGTFVAFGSRGAGATGSGTSHGGGFFLPPVKDKKAADEALEADYKAIIQAGLGMADRKLVRILVQEGWDRRKELEEWGVPFRAGRGLRRHGVDILYALSPQLAQAGVQIHERTMITDLLVHNGQCVGAVGIGFEGGTWVFRAKAVILGTGGDENLYLYNIHPPCLTGDGYVMAYEAGAALMNMEFGQNFPYCVFPGKIHFQTRWALQPAAKLTNGLGEEFLSRYCPPGVKAEDVVAVRRQHNPMTCRDGSHYFDVAVTKEILAGRTGPNGGVFLDMTQIDVGREIEEWLAYRSIPFREKPIELALCRQCAHGGLVIDENCLSTLPGLYGAGGESITGPHGADRLGGHSLGSTQVFGRRAGQSASQYAMGLGPVNVPQDVVDRGLERLRGLQQPRGDFKPGAVKQEIRRQMSEDMFIIRNEESCDRVLRTVARLRDSLPGLAIESPWDRIEGMEALNLLTLAEIETRAALMRTESRGPHYRDDYPERDDTNWLKGIVVRKEEGQMTVTPDAQAVDPEWKDTPGDLHPHWG